MNVLAIGAHPDDIEFGCGGTLLQFARRRANIFLLVLTKGDVGGKAPVRQKEQTKACQTLRAKKVFWGTFSDTHIPTNKKAIEEIEAVIRAVKPEVIFFNYFEMVKVAYLGAVCFK